LNAQLFSTNEGYDIYFKVFLKSELGLIYQSIPWDQIGTHFEPFKSQSPQGRNSIFTIKGAMGLMFLKHYLNLSDAKLIQRVNTDKHLQYFCGVQISPISPVRDKDIVGRWRRFFGNHLNIDSLQNIFIDHWKPYMSQTHVLMDDATCFESHIKFPTDVKLLYDCSEYLFDRIDEICLKFNIQKPRTKYRYQKNRQTNYSKLKRKPIKRTTRRIRQLLYWVQKGDDKLQQILNQHPEIHDYLPESMYAKIKTIRTIRAQQAFKFKIPGYKIKNRIVSLYKPYVRPIVRGKETKKTEFGAKVHISQVDQLNFIEYLSFDAFHEGIRMKKSIERHEKIFGKCKHYAGDQIYANNKNRKHVTQKGIITCFKQKGRKPRIQSEKDEIRLILNKARATILEGGFGNVKNNYGLNKIRARTKNTEIAWIFFGIHTANAVNISKRIKELQKENTKKVA